MKNRLFKLFSLMLIVSLLASVVLAVPVAVKAEPQADAKATLEVQEGVTLHCWNWSFKEIEARMETIATLGYTAIQTSPIQQAKQKTLDFPTADWWVYYQPMGFHIDNSGDSALGTKADFESMCATAHKYGIKVIVDVVANHMGNTEDGKNGLASTIIEALREDPDCWHDITKNTTNWGSRYEVTQYCMTGLPDLDTSNDKVQQFVLDFLKECIDAGADGFRFDAAKHIETPDDGELASDFWPTVINGATDYAKSSRDIDLYCYGEMLDNPGGNIGVGSYTKYMSITDNTWCAAALSAITGGNSGAYSATYHRPTDASQLVLWAESHDNYADNSTRKISDGDIAKVWAMVASRKDAMSLYLARPANFSQLLGHGSDTAWASPEVMAINHFHNRFVGQDEYVSKQGDFVAVERGTSGVMLVNCKGGETEVSMNVSRMANGTYTDRITGNVFTVANGKITGTVGESGIAVVYACTACPHTAHGLDGFCTSCGALIGHEYDENRTCTCGDQLVANRTVYFINKGLWSKVNFYSWYDDNNIITQGWPGNAMTHVADNIYSCEVPVDAVNIIFNDTYGIQTDNLELPAEDSGLNMYDAVAKKWIAYGTTGDDQQEEPPKEETPSEPTQPTDAPAQNNAQTTGEKEPVSVVTIVAIAVIALSVVVVAVCVIVIVTGKKKTED